jgi:hypothetical protein
MLRTGRLAYKNPQWTPARSHTSPIRDPADLAHSPGDVITVLAAVHHHATDAISQIAATDHQAVLDAAADSRLYMPTRLLPDKYDIPHPYTRAPRAHTAAVLAAYDTAIDATARITAVLDDLAIAANMPSSVLAAARRASMATRRDRRRPQDQRPARGPHTVTPVPGRTEQALRKLQIRDPALLLRAAVIDQAAHDLVAEATARAHSRVSVTGRPDSRPAARIRQAPDRPGWPTKICHACRDPGSRSRTSRRVQGLGFARPRPSCAPATHRRPRLGGPTLTSLNIAQRPSAGRSSTIHARSPAMTKTRLSTRRPGPAQERGAASVTESESNRRPICLIPRISPTRRGCAGPGHRQNAGRRSASSGRAAVPGDVRITAGSPRFEARLGGSRCRFPGLVQGDGWVCLVMPRSRNYPGPSPVWAAARPRHSRVVRLSCPAESAVARFGWYSSGRRARRCAAPTSGRSGTTLSAEPLRYRWPSSHGPVR